MPATLRWTVHPASDHPGRALLVAVLVALAGLLAFQVAESAVVGLGGGLLLLASLRAYFLPRRYVLDEQGAREEGLLAASRRLAWTDVRRVEAVAHGVYLSPLHARSAWLPDRGLFLRTSGNGPDVAEFARRQAAD